MVPTKLIITTSKEVPALITTLEKGTPSLVAITASSVTAEDIAEVERRNEKKLKKLLPGNIENPEFDEEGFTMWTLKKVKQRAHKALVNGSDLIIISETGLLPDDYQEIKRDIESTYADKYKSFPILHCECTEVEDGTKTVWFISGVMFDDLAELLVKGDPEHSKIISDPDIKKMDKQFKTETANPDTKLLVVNISDFSQKNKDREFYNRISETEEFIVQTMKLPDGEKKEVVEGNTTFTEHSEEKGPADQLKEIQNGLLEKISIINKELRPGLIKKGKENLYKFSVRVLSKRLQMEPENVLEKIFTANEFRKRLFAAAEKDNHITAEERKFLEDGFGIE